MPATCPCGQKYDTTHALYCKKGGFVTNRHNNIRDYEAILVAKIHTDVEAEPSLQAIEGEVVTGIPADNARPNIGLGVYGVMVRTCFLIFELLTLTLHHSIT